MKVIPRTWSDVAAKLSVVQPVVLPVALATSLPADMADALSAKPTYPELFAAAFGGGAITPAQCDYGFVGPTCSRVAVPSLSAWFYLALVGAVARAGLLARPARSRRA